MACRLGWAEALLEYEPVRISGLEECSWVCEADRILTMELVYDPSVRAWI